MVSTNTKGAYSLRSRGLLLMDPSAVICMNDSTGYKGLLLVHLICRQAQRTASLNIQPVMHPRRSLYDML